MQPRFTSLVAPLPSTVPFVGPEAQERARGVAFRARLGANESVFGPSPKAIAAMRQAAAECWMYCDPENYDLKTALAQELGLSPANIVVEEGIDSLFVLHCANVHRAGTSLFPHSGLVRPSTSMSPDMAAVW